MGKPGDLEDTLGPYWSNFNADTPRASRQDIGNTHKDSIGTHQTSTSFHLASSTSARQETAQHIEHGFQPDSANTNAIVRHKADDNSVSLNHEFQRPNAQHLSASVLSTSRGAHSSFILSNSTVEGPANQTLRHKPEDLDGVNHAGTNSTIRQTPAIKVLQKNCTSASALSDEQQYSSFRAPWKSSQLVSEQPSGFKPNSIGLPLSRGNDRTSAMSSRPGAGRRAGRDSGKDNDVEAELFNRVLEAVRKAKEYNDESLRLGTEILALEEEIKSKGRSTTEQHRKLDDLYRKKLRNAEAEKKVHDEEDIVNNLAILATMRSTDDTPAPRSGHHNAKSSRGKGGARQTLDSDAVADSPGPTPSDSRIDSLKRGKERGGSGTPQRSSSVASQHRSGTALAKDDAASSTSTTASTAAGDTASTQHKGILAERAGTLVPGVEVFYKFPKGSPDDLGVGIQCIIKKVWADKKPNIIYDVQDPEPDPNGKINVHKATAKDLYPIPSTAETRHLPSFPVGATVYARYPDTDTFYKAKVVRAVTGSKSDGEKGKGGGDYTLRFEGEEDDKEQPVERRFVLDAKMRWSA